MIDIDDIPWHYVERIRDAVLHDNRVFYKDRIIAKNGRFVRPKQRRPDSVEPDPEPSSLQSLFRTLIQLQIKELSDESTALHYRRVQRFTAYTLLKKLGSVYLRELRDSLTQDRVAQAVECDRVAVSMFEHGKVLSMRTDTLLSLVRFYSDSETRATKAPAGT